LSLISLLLRKCFLPKSSKGRSQRLAFKMPKGKPLPGHMGTDTVTVQNLEIVKVDTERNVILVKGAIPGPKNSYVTVKSAIKK
jgi:large subunit ribosomal protein L3